MTCHYPKGTMPAKFRGYTCYVGVTQEEVVQHARGSFQAALLTGGEAWSLATLKGKAAKYGRTYAASRNNLLTHLRAYYDLEWVRYGRGSRKVLVIRALTSPTLEAAYERYTKLP